MHNGQDLALQVPVITQTICAVVGTFLDNRRGMTIRSAAIVLALLIAAPQALEARGYVPMRTRARLAKRSLKKMSRRVRNKIFSKRAWSKTRRRRRTLGAMGRAKLQRMGQALRSGAGKLNPFSAKRRAARSERRNERKAARDQAWNEYQHGIATQSPTQAAQAYHQARNNTSRFARPFSRRLRKMGKGTLKLTRKAAQRAARHGDVDGAVRFYNLTAGIKNGRGLTGGTKRRARRAIRKAIKGAAKVAARGDLEHASAGLRALHEIGSTKAAKKMEDALTKRAEINNRRYFNSERQGALMSHNMLSLVQQSQAMRGQRPTRRVARAMKKARKNAWKELKNAGTQEAFNSTVELIKAHAEERGAQISRRDWRRVRSLAKKNGLTAPGEARYTESTVAQRVNKQTQSWQQAPAQQEAPQASGNYGYYGEVLP